MARRKRQSGKGLMDSMFGPLGNVFLAGLAAQKASKGGKKRVVRKRRMRGRGDEEKKEELSFLQKVNKIAKDSKVVSKSLKEFEAPEFLGTVAGSLGYGRKRQRGAGFFSDLGNFIQSPFDLVSRTAGLGPLKQFGDGRRKRRVRKMKGAGIGDTIQDILGGLGRGTGTGLGGGVHNLFGGLFGGRKRRMRGRGEEGEAVSKVAEKAAAAVVEKAKEDLSFLQKVNKVAKDSQVISRSLNEFGAPSWASGVASSLGYGRRRRRMKGAGIGSTIGDVLGGLGSGIGSGVGGGVYNLFSSLFGGARKRKMRGGMAHSIMPLPRYDNLMLGSGRLAY